MLKEIFASLSNPTITGTAEELAQEVAKPEPDKEIMADALETGLKRIKKLTDFGDAIDRLRPPVEATAGWLGQHGHKLLPLVGLVL